MSAIAIIGMACRYAEARSPHQLWENVLAQRRSFRRIPQIRLRVDDYAVEGQTEDRITLKTAAVLEDYEFDRVRFHVSKDTFASTDLTHWLALDTASQALEDAKLLHASDSQRERTGVYIGNSLTGEFSRASLLRLRWPYVRRVLMAALEENNTSHSEIEKLVQQIETLYKAPFPSTTEESLAGGLSNTIAGRICNYFNLKGGGYTVDGACASSLLAVTTACSALQSGDVDIAIAGGVDLSLDPFELAGFSKLGALASDKMRIFDEQSAGFWPGEGCGMVVLMRQEEALAHHLSPYAVIRGWGISSDGSGGITRPELSGQILALRRAYQRAEYGIDDIAYFEGHGTGTTVGDAIELQALSAARREASAQTAPAAIGSIKANIGHTKAAAGVAGLIKATMAVQARILPPTTGCDHPHAELTAEKPTLRVLKEGELWPDHAPLRASVSAMGFGGINTHVTLEAVDTFRRKSFAAFEQTQLESAQDCELFLFQAPDTQQLASQLLEALAFAGELSYAELTDFAAHLQKNLSPGNSVRAACVASTPDELEKNIRKLHEWCTAGIADTFDSNQGVFLSGSTMRQTAIETINHNGAQPPSAATEEPSQTDRISNESKPGNPHIPRIGFLFPGQGSPVYTNGGIWSRRFSSIRDLYKRANLPQAQSIATETAQPCVATASLAGLTALKMLGIEASVAVGHSLGEITALCWAGACGEDDLLRIVSHRGQVMARKAAASGTMASIRADWQEVQRRLNGDPLVIAGYNSPRQTVISGDAQAIRQFTARLSSDGISTTMLPVSHAFHSPLVENVASAFSGYLASERFAGLRHRVVSTVTGSVLEQDVNLHELLTSQITMPVRFADAITAAAAEADLFIEVGPGAVLSGIAAECTNIPVVALNAGSESLRGLLLATGAAFASGAEVRTSALFERRFFRPFDAQRRHTFLANPCETASNSVLRVPSAPPPARTVRSEAIAPTSAVDVLRNLVAQRTELPLTTVRPESRFLDDLHLNSIIISQIVLEAATQLSLSPPVAPAEYTNATIREAAETLEGLRPVAPAPSGEKHPQGIEPWLRVLAMEFVEQPRRVASKLATSAWKIAAMEDSSLRAALENCVAQPPPAVSDTRVAQLPSAVPLLGMLCCVPRDRNESTALFLLESIQTALKQNVQQMVFVQQNGGAAALARTLYLEHPHIKVTVVDVPLEHPQAAEWMMLEANSASGFTEVRYDAAGIRYEPHLGVLWPEQTGSIVLQAANKIEKLYGAQPPGSPLCAGFAHNGVEVPSAATEESFQADKISTDSALLPDYHTLNNKDVLLVSGGGKGIAAECALQLARDSGCRLALLGRSDPARDQELKENLLRFTDSGVSFRYFPADITDSAATATAIQQIETEVCAITAVLHGAGVNAPKRLEEITASDLRHTLAPKVTGLQNILDNINPEQLRLLLTFGSIIGRAGLHGEGHYALANDWLNLTVERWQKEHPECRCLNLEWSVWAGAGMGQRLGVLDTLIRQGITPLPLDDAISSLKTMLAWKQAPASSIITSRFGELPTLQFQKAELPLLRYLEHVQVHYPGIELVADAQLSNAADLYISEHTFKGEQLLPAVCGIEAMAQVAMALQETVELPQFRNLHFEHPIVVPARKPVRIRIAALRREPGKISLVVRCSATSFQVDHFSAECVFTSDTATKEMPAALQNGHESLLLDPSRDLYGSILFHQGRFCRVEKYHLLQADRSVAELTPPLAVPWYARHIPAEFVLGDAASRNAAIHCIQTCIPHKTVLPTGIDRIIPNRSWTHERATIHAIERVRDGDNFIYDLWIRDAHGNTLEFWEGLHLRAVAAIENPRPWPLALLVPYLERKLAEFIPGAGLRISFANCPDAISEAVQQMTGPEARLTHRPDGKPEIFGCAEAPDISLSHAGSLTLITLANSPVGCDLEPVAGRDQSSWEKLLGAEGFALAQLIAEKSEVTLDTAATQAWTLKESLRKCGASFAQSLRLESCSPDGWITLSAGGFRAATYHAQLQAENASFAFGFVVSSLRKRL